MSHSAMLLFGKPQAFVFMLCVTAITVFSGWPRILIIYDDYIAPQNASLCACLKCLRDFDEGFTKLLNDSPAPFLSSDSQNISESIFNYWKRLQRDRSNFSEFNANIKKLVQMFPLNTGIPEPGPDRCLSCAVVGNSGNLINSHLGPLIDFHDIVIRMNKAPTKGYESHVGSKTTHHVMYPHSVTDLNSTIHLVFFPFKTSDLEWLIESFSSSRNGTWASGFKANKDLVVILNPTFMKYVHFSWLKKRGRYPSTGFLTLVLGLTICDEVDVFGFGANQRGIWDHYFEKIRTRKPFKTGQHPGSIEQKYIQQLRKQLKIRFFAGV